MRTLDMTFLVLLIELLLSLNERTGAKKGRLDIEPDLDSLTLGVVEPLVGSSIVLQALISESVNGWPRLEYKKSMSLLLECSGGDDEEEDIPSNGC